MISIAVIGASGFVGNALVRALEKNTAHKVIPVVRSNYEEKKKASYDVLIHSAMPSKRFWAKQHPEEDYCETVKKTEDLYRHWHYKKFILISTVSARTEQETVYGKHKAEAEKICSGKKDLIIRLSAMFGPQLSKGSLIDMLQGNKVFVSGESRYPFASLEFVCSWIARNLNRSGLIEVGAKNTLSLQEMADHLGKKIAFEGPLENQTLAEPSPDFPDAKEVYTFMEKLIKAGQS